MIKFDEKGLVPVIVQHYETGAVLMLGYANNEALQLTFESGHVWFYSRSRQELWHKGATSGHTLEVHSISKDCDSDAILVQAKPAGPVCHTGNNSCFYQAFDSDDIV